MAYIGGTPEEIVADNKLLRIQQEEMDEGSQSNQQEDDMNRDNQSNQQEDNMESLSQGIYNCRDRPLFERINEWELSTQWACKHFVFTDIHDYSKLQKE